MALYKVQAPDGTEHTIEGPDGASPEEVIKQAQTLVPDKPASLDDIYQTEDFQKAPESKQKDIIRQNLLANNKVNQEGYSPDSAVPGFIQRNVSPNVLDVISGPNVNPVESEYKYGYLMNPETFKRRMEVAKGGITSTAKGIEDAATAVGSKLSGNPYTPEQEVRLKQHRLEQAQLEELQKRTPETTGTQTMPAVVATAPLGVIAPISRAIGAVEAVAPYTAGNAALGIGSAGVEIGGWLKTLGAAVDTGIQGAVAGKAMPTNSAANPNETPAQAAQNYTSESNQNAKVGGIIGSSIPLVGAAIPKVARPVGAAYDWIRRVFGSTPASEKLAAEKFTTSYSAERGQPVTAPEIASEIQQGNQSFKDVNTQFGTNFNPTTAQAAGDVAVTGMQKTFAPAIATGLDSAKNTIPNVATKEAANKEELAGLINQTKQVLTPAEQAALPATAAKVGENPVKYVEDTYKPVDFNDLEPVVAQKNLNKDAVDVMETAKKNYDSLYDSIDPKGTIRTSAASTKKAISDSFADLNEYGVLTKADKKILGDFYEGKATSARQLVELNANLSDLAKRLKGDPKLAPAFEQVQEIRAASKADLLGSSDQTVRSRAEQANELFKNTQNTLYNRPKQFLGQDQPTALSELRGKAGQATSLEGEKATNLTGTSEDIADYRRGAEFVRGNTDVADRNVKNVLMADLRTQLRKNATPEVFDTWAAKNATKLDSVPGFKDELTAYKTALVKEEQNIATATRLMGGADAAKAAVKDAMDSPEKMQALVNLATKDPTGGALKGLQQHFQEHIEGAISQTVRSGGEIGNTVTPTKYFDDLLANPDTKKALQVLWGAKGQNLETASELFKRLNVERGSPIAGSSVREQTDKELGKATVAQGAHGVRGLAVSSLNKALNLLTNREFNRVMARAMADPDYAVTILNAYKQPTAASAAKALDALNGAAIGAVVPVVEKNKTPPNTSKVKPVSEDTTKLLDKVSISKTETLQAPEAPVEVQTTPEAPKGSTLEQEAARHNIPVEDIKKNFTAESNLSHIDASGKVKKNPDSTATGFTQITGPAVVDAKKYLKEHGVPDADKLDPNKEEDNVKLGVAYYARQREIAAKSVDNPTPKDVRVFYVMGEGDAPKMMKLAALSTGSQMPAAEYFPKAAAANRGLFYNKTSSKPRSIAGVLRLIKSQVH